MPAVFTAGMQEKESVLHPQSGASALTLLKVAPYFKQGHAVPPQK